MPALWLKMGISINVAYAMRPSFESVCKFDSIRARIDCSHPCNNAGVLNEVRHYSCLKPTKLTVFPPMSSSDDKSGIHADRNAYCCHCEAYYVAG